MDFGVPTDNLDGGIRITDGKFFLMHLMEIGNEVFDVFRRLKR